MSEGGFNGIHETPKAAKQVATPETAGAEKIPSYLEDPNDRQERESKALTESVDVKIATLLGEGALEGLEGDALREKITEVTREILLDLVEVKYGSPENQDVKLAFHNREHSELVTARVERFIQITNTFQSGRISSEEKANAILAAAGHDAEHVFERTEKGLRKRKTGDGEKRSAARITTVKEAANNALIKAGKEAVYTVDPDQDVEIINVTIPSFSLEEGVTQKLLTKETPLTTRYLALADLADFGIDGSEKLLKSGRQLAIEDNSNIIEAIRLGTVGDNEEAYRLKLLGTMQIQPGFAESRKRHFLDELNGIEPEGLKAEIAKEFRYFEGEADELDKPFAQSIQFLNAEVARLETLPFDTLIAYLGVHEFLNKTVQ
ncbi:MAG: hypothetical protein AB203_03620 [Parcubacteria bacterium C7867-008]|nr:MAG: hypothetical protein AB203_03620 [Parcubacteria bacterium C7867-008]